ncbi:WYL domain-containing protein [Psychromonas sp. MME1]|uniref:WYL domain-containing protein n=2 Tax=unclassified Psychromonas TaxID=2614957 RepID=UPI0034E2844C
MKKSDIERFNYIEYIVWWEGQINASHLMRHFDLSRDSASSILKNYDSQYPNNLQYDQSIKARVITENFQPLNDVSSFDGYLNLIKNANHEAISNCIEEVATPLRNINAQLLRPILKAIREQLAIDIGYISLTSPDYLDRIIEPHSLIFDGLRWHVRAYCRKNAAFRDFVLSRFNGIAVFEGEAQCKVEQDELWQTYTDVVFMPDPRLVDKQQAIIASDFQMINNLKTIKTRIALLNYLLIRLRLDTYKNRPEEQQIVLTPDCRNSISKYLP